MSGNKRISARNQLRGTVEGIVLGRVTAKVTVRVGNTVIESMITRQKGEGTGRAKSDSVTALIKETWVMIMVN